MFKNVETSCDLSDGPLPKDRNTLVTVQGKIQPLAVSNDRVQKRRFGKSVGAWKHQTECLMTTGGQWLVMLPRGSPKPSHRTLGRD